MYFSQLAFDIALTGCITVSFSSLQFTHAFTGSITVSFSVCSLTMLSQVVLQFFFSLLLIMQHKSFFSLSLCCLIIHNQLYRCMCYGLTVRVMLSQVIELPVLNSPRGVVPPDLSTRLPNFVTPLLKILTMGLHFAAENYHK